MSSKKQKKQKMKTLSLQEFTASLEPTTTGQNVIYATKPVESKSWADEVDEDDYVIRDKVKIVLPSAPRASRGPDVDESKIPETGPFTAHIGNIHYDVTEGDIYGFFRGLDILGLRLPRDTSQRLRGFGYVEFGTRNDLIDALCMNEKVLCGRPLRISLGQEGRGITGGGGGRDNVDKTSDDWRSEAKAVFGSGGYTKDYGRSRDDHYGGGRRDDFYSGRQFDDYGRRDDRDRQGFRRRDDDSRNPSEEEQWRQPIVRRPDFQGDEGGRMRRDYSQGRGRRYEPRERDPSPDFSDVRATRPVLAPTDSSSERSQSPDNRDNGPRRYGERSERSYNNPPETKQSSPPRERKKLVLAPRTIKDSTESTPAVANPAIFGDARPVDTAAREREIEQKIEAAKLEEPTRRITILQRPRSISDTPKPSSNVQTSTEILIVEENSTSSLIREDDKIKDAEEPEIQSTTIPVNNAWNERRERRNIILSSKEKEVDDRTTIRDNSPALDSEEHKDTNSEPEDERDLRRSGRVEHEIVQDSAVSEQGEKEGNDDDEFHLVGRRRKKTQITTSDHTNNFNNQRGRGGNQMERGSSNRGRGSTNQSNSGNTRRSQIHQNFQYH